MTLLTLKGHLNPSCWLLGVLVFFLPEASDSKDFAPFDPDDPQLGIFGGLEHHCWLDDHRCALQLCACPGWENMEEYGRTEGRLRRMNIDFGRIWRSDLEQHMYWNDHAI